MSRDHELSITVSSGGAVDFKVHYRDQVPDLLSRFSSAVVRKAKLRFWLKSRYERRVLRAAKGMPRFAQRTIRQHLLRDRALLIAEREAVKAERQRRKEARITAHQKVVARDDTRRDTPPRSAEAPGRIEARTSDAGGHAQSRPVAATQRERPTGAAPSRVVPSPEPVQPERRGDDPVGRLLARAGTAWSPAAPPRLSLLDRLDREQPIPKAIANPATDRSRGR
ncbi:MAG: hypothetical protein AB7U66_13320 [Hyphomicrobiaceae bacterium]